MGKGVGSGCHIIPIIGKESWIKPSTKSSGWESANALKQFARLFEVIKLLWNKFTDTILELIKTLGFTEEEPKEGTCNKWENLDTKYTLFMIILNN